MSTPAVAPLDPQPVSPSLERHMRDVLSQIPSGRTGVVTGAVTTSGVELGGGARARLKRFDVAGSGWVGREWGAGKGWLAGVRGSIAF